MKSKVLTSFVLIAALAGASSASAQQQQTCDPDQSTPQTNDDCTALGGLVGSGAGAGIAIVGVAAVALIGAASGGGRSGGGGETPNTFILDN